MHHGDTETLRHRERCSGGFFICFYSWLFLLRIQLLYFFQEAVKLVTEGFTFAANGACEAAEFLK
ncbi:MAG: hypothetical protein DMG65_13650 [Candidatus Angelobacter sp. Gp1-AA117]|nr:MAG: hypothetical protein DMG65_13650 [Candidatus Angelobacter sp. Gp1-AA117]